MSWGIIGEFKKQPRIKLPQDYFIARNICLDCRYPDTIEIDETANFGFGVKILVGTHNIEPGKFGDVQIRPITIAKQAWVASEAILFNCRIGEGSIVAAGTVVRSMKVLPWTMVEGNPAKVIKHLHGNKWAPCDCPDIFCPKSEPQC